MHLVHEWIQWLVELIVHWGYGGIFILMMLESTFVPVPSELVMPPAGYAAAMGHMNAFVAVLAGTLGSMAGASINYGLAVWLGRPFLLRFGKYILCPPHKFEKMEKFFLKHGEFGTFTGRLILGVRHFISFPAGLARMKMWHFLGYTALGSAIWCSILTAIGYYIGRESVGKSAAELAAMYTKYGKLAAYGAAVACFVMIAFYVWRHKRKAAADAAA